MIRRRHPRIGARRIHRDPESPDFEDEEFFISNENPISDLFHHIGRHHICVLREHYFNLCLTSPNRSAEDIYLTELHLTAAKKRHYQSLEHLLISSTIDKNARNRFGQTALLLSLSENVDENIINILIEHGADCTIGCTRGITPLHIAALDNKVNLLPKLIEKGADVNAVSNVGVTPLHLAILASNYEIVCQLLRYNANPLLITELEFTPLMLALSFRDIDLRICELLCSYDIHTGTRLGNPLYCAIKGQHIFAERLILEGADVNYLRRYRRIDISCLIEAISQNEKHLFDLIWPRFDQEAFNNTLKHFLVYFADSCGLKGDDLVECLKLILGSKYGSGLVTVYYNYRNCSFLEKFFDDLQRYRLTSENCRQIIQALPIVFQVDVYYIYRKFNFKKELMDVLKLYEVHRNDNIETTHSSMFVDFLCYNRVQSQSYNLKEILHYLKYRTPNIVFRDLIYRTYSGIGVSSDAKLEKLITLYHMCKDMIVKHTLPSLQELSRDKLRNILFSHNKRPYAAISSLPVSDMFKDILFLKRPIYC